MSDQIITKQCSKCKEIKPVSEFAPRNNRPSGLQYWCRQCQKQHRQKPESIIKQKLQAKRYRTTQKYKNYHLIYQKLPIYKDYLSKYRQTDKFKTYTKQYIKTPNGRKNRTTITKRYREKNREKFRAQWVVKYAVKIGKLPKVTSCICFYCGNNASQYHHWHGYDKQYRLDVIPICYKCHRSTHNTIQLYLPLALIP